MAQRNVSASLDEAEARASAAEETLDKVNARCMGCFGPKRRLAPRRGGGGTAGAAPEGLVNTLKSLVAREKLPSTKPPGGGATAASAAPAVPLFADATLAREAAAQDETLRRLDCAVADLGVLSRRIGDELQTQAPALEGMSGRADDLSGRFKTMNTTGKLGAIKHKKKAARSTTK